MLVGNLRDPETETETDARFPLGLLGLMSHFILKPQDGINFKLVGCKSHYGDDFNLPTKMDLLKMYPKRLLHITTRLFFCLFP